MGYESLATLYTIRRCVRRFIIHIIRPRELWPRSIPVHSFRKFMQLRSNGILSRTRVDRSRNPFPFFFFWNFHSSPRLFIWENSKRIFVSFYLESYGGWTFGRSFKYYSKQVSVVRITSSKLWKRFDTNANGGWNFSRVEYLSVFRIIFLHLTTINPSTCVTPSSSSWSSSLRTFNLKLAKKNLVKRISFTLAWILLLQHPIFQTLHPTNAPDFFHFWRGGWKRGRT